MKNFNMTIATAAVIAAGICIAGATGAAAQQVPASVKISYAGLDLSSDAGRQVMERRIKLAAEQLCGDIKMERIHTVREETARCVRETIANTNFEMVRPATVAVASR